MEQSLLSQSVWLSLPLATRSKLAELFEFPERGSVQTMYGPNGPEVITDGYGYNHLKLITTEKMQEITGSESDNFYELFKKTVRFVNGEEEERAELLAIDELIETVEEAILDNLEQEMEEEKPRFCAYCDSKGVRHLKICTRNETKTA